MDNPPALEVLHKGIRNRTARPRSRPCQCLPPCYHFIPQVFVVSVTLDAFNQLAEIVLDPLPVIFMPSQGKCRGGRNLSATTLYVGLRASLVAGLAQLTHRSVMSSMNHAHTEGMKMPQSRAARGEKAIQGAGKARITISLSRDKVRFIRAHSGQAGFRSVSAFIERLVAEAQARTAIYYDSLATSPGLATVHRADRGSRTLFV
jgi:hypothetical protein